MDRGSWQARVQVPLGPSQHPSPILVAGGSPGVYPLCCTPNPGTIAEGSCRHPLPTSANADMGPPAGSSGGLHVDHGGERALPNAQPAQSPQSDLPSGPDHRHNLQGESILILEWDICILLTFRQSPLSSSPLLALLQYSDVGVILKQLGNFGPFYNISMDGLRASAADATASG